MESKITLRPLIRISKTKSREIIGNALDYESPYHYIYVRDDESCMLSGCPFQKEYLCLAASLKEEKEKQMPDISAIRDITKKLENLKEMCSSSCPHMKEKKIYQNDNSNYRLYHAQYAGRRLPKTSLKLYFLLYAIPQVYVKNASLHFIKDVSLTALATTLGVAPITVLDSLDKLVAFHYISYSHGRSYKHFNIIINDYDNMHLPAKKGGAGYFTINSDMMYQILTKTNVNDLRLEILQLLRIDDKERLTGENWDSYKIHDLKNILPSHMNYGKNYEKVSSQQPSNFIKEIADGMLKFTLRHSLTMRIDSEMYERERLKSIQDLLKKNDVSLYHDGLTAGEVEQIDQGISLLVREYTDEHIVSCIMYLVSNYTKNTVKAFGALLRTLCQRFYIATVA